MATIGGTSCSFVRGNAAAQKNRVQTFQRPGIDGYGAVVLGLGNSRSRFQLVLYDSDANIRTWLTTVEGYQGTVVEITNDDGEQVPNLLVERVGQPRVTAADQGSGEKRAEVAVEGVVL